jgi:katanin p60 ATPase-containing subunit A1
MKTELLVQMDGLLSTEAQVCVLAATNLPWELDLALLRRLEKRILVPLPTDVARATIMRGVLAPKGGSALDFEQLAAQTEGYSGSDLALVCKEAAMRPLRRLLSQLDLDACGRDQRMPLPQPEPVCDADVVAALRTTRSTAQAYSAKYIDWEREFGSV